MPEFPLDYKLLRAQIMSCLPLVLSKVPDIDSKLKSLSPVRLCECMDGRLSSSSVHRILQARVLECVPVPISRGSSHPRDQTQVSHIAVDSLLSEPPGSPRILKWVAYPFSKGSSQLRNRTIFSCTAGRFFTI